MIETAVYVLIGAGLYVYIAFFALGVAVALSYSFAPIWAILWPIFFAAVGARVAVQAGMWLGTRLETARLPDDGDPITIPVTYIDD